MLRKRTEFEAVLRSDLRVSGRNFVVRAHANGMRHARLGIIAGRKAASRAVDRNRGKRLIREVFRATEPTIGAYDIAVQLRSDLRSQDNRAVRAELRQLLRSLACRCAAARHESPALQPRATGNRH